MRIMNSKIKKWIIPSIIVILIILGVLFVKTQKEQDERVQGGIYAALLRAEAMVEEIDKESKIVKVELLEDSSFFESKTVSLDCNDGIYNFYKLETGQKIVFYFFYAYLGQETLLIDKIDIDVP